MPLLRCIECGREVSSFATVCPYCGCPVNLTLNEDPSGAKFEQTGQPAFRPATLSGEQVNKLADAEIRKSQDLPMGFEVKSSLGSVTFFRDALVDLAADKNTPPDVFESDFSMVVPSEKHFCAVTARVVGEYSVDIGENVTEQEEYWDEETGLPVIQKEEKVQWSPLKERVVETRLIPCALDEDPMDEGQAEAYRQALLSHAFDQSEETDDVILPTKEVLKDALSRAEQEVKAECEDSLPGDYQADFAFTSQVKADRCVCHTVPAFTLPFSYKDGEYAKSFFATKNHAGASFGVVPVMQQTEKYDDADDRMSPFRWTALVLILFSLIASAVVIAIGGLLIQSAGIIIIAAFFGAALLCFASYWITRGVRHLRIDKINQRRKRIALEKLLAEVGLDPLTEEEKKAIMGGKRV